MSKNLVVMVVSVWSLLVAGGAQAGPVPSASILKKLGLAAVTTAPAKAGAATQPAGASAAANVDAEPPIERLRETMIGQLFQGKKTLTAGEAVQVGFWWHAATDLMITAMIFLPRLVVALIVFLVFYGLYRALRRLVMGSVSKARVDSSVRDLLSSGLKWGIVGFGFIAACNQLGIQIGGLLTGTAIIGLAIGFAAQETLANFIACLVIFWDKPFKVGDYIDVDGRYGRVSRITFRSTRLVNGDGEVVVIPNTMMLSTKVSNRSTNNLCRVKVAIRLGYEASIERARAVLLATTEADERIVPEPAASVGLSQLADDAMHLTLGFWIVDESAQKSMESEYLEKAKDALDAAGIQIPGKRMEETKRSEVGNLPLLAA